MNIQKRSLAGLYPGTKVPVGPGGKEHVTVYPIGLQHIEQHAEIVVRIAADLLPFLNSIDAKAITDQTLTVLVPGIAKHARAGLMDFVNHFIDVDIYALSFEDQGKVIETFLLENLFRPGVLTAWGKAVSALWQTIVGDGETPSPNSPPPGSPSASSSTASGDSPTPESTGGGSEIFVAPLNEIGGLAGPMTRTTDMPH